MDNNLFKNQEKENFLLKDFEFLTGYGRANIKEGKYEVLPFYLQISTEASNLLKKLNTKNGSIKLFLEPNYLSSLKPEKEYEFGVGIGIKYKRPLLKKIFSSIGFSTGPHYISIKTKDQAKGFLFSHNLDLGFYYSLKNGKGVYLGYRFCHMSNANLRKPNLGINNNFLTLGISFSL